MSIKPAEAVHDVVSLRSRLKNEVMILGSRWLGARIVVVGCPSRNMRKRYSASTSDGPRRRVPEDKPRYRVKREPKGKRTAAAAAAAAAANAACNNCRNCRNCANPVISKYKSKQNGALALASKSNSKY